MRIDTERVSTLQVDTRRAIPPDPTNMQVPRIGGFELGGPWLFLFGSNDTVTFYEGLQSYKPIDLSGADPVTKTVSTVVMVPTLNLKPFTSFTLRHRWTVASGLEVPTADLRFRLVSNGGADGSEMNVPILSTVGVKDTWHLVSFDFSGLSVFSGAGVNLAQVETVSLSPQNLVANNPPGPEPRTWHYTAWIDDWRGSLSPPQKLKTSRTSTLALDTEKI